MEQINLANLHRAKQFEAIVRYWNSVENHKSFNEWDYLYSINAAYAQKLYDLCGNIYDECVANGCNPSMLNNKYGWSLYQTAIKSYEPHVNEESYLETVEKILSLSTDDQYSPKAKTVLDVTKNILDSNIGEAVDYTKVVDYLNQLNPSILSKNTYKAPDGKSYASECEKWYSQMIKSLYEMKQYDECIALCDKGLADLTEFTSNNKIWFAYRKSQALLHSGRVEEGLQIAEKLAQGFIPHWCLYSAVYNCYIALNQIENALQYAAKCATFKGKDVERINFYTDCAKNLESSQHSYEANLLRKLILLLYEENEWELKNGFTDWDIPEEIQKMNKNQVSKELNHFWNQLLNQNKMTGRITKLLKEGLSGFILGEDGESYYFNAKDFKANKDKMVENQTVKFSVTERFNKLKNEMGKVAIDITI